MTNCERTLLLLGESDVGKTHFGAQVLRRLNSGFGTYALVEAANLIPFRDALDKISQGLSAPHTPSTEYSQSVWTLRSNTDESETDLVWPDYGGEQLTAMVDTKSLPVAWREKLITATGWIYMVRPSQAPLPEDILNRAATNPASDNVAEGSLSPQAKLVEILQMLRYKTSAYVDHKSAPPPLAVLLSCYDELDTQDSPSDYCRINLPMFYQYICSNWPPDQFRIFGLSQLGQPLSQNKPDEDYAASGPENRGWVIDEYGRQSDDLLQPVEWLLNTIANS